MNPRRFNTRDGRFTLEPAWRRAARGPADRVRDGWTLTDTITGARHRVDTIFLANMHTAATLREEWQLWHRAGFRPDWIDLDQILPSSDDHRYPLREIWVTHPALGSRHKLGVFATGSDLRERVTALVQHLTTSPPRP